MFKMNQEQEDHLEYIQDEFDDLLDDKFRKGAEEHKTQLHKDYTPLQLTDFAIDEAVDQVVYLLTLRKALEEAEQ